MVQTPAQYPGVEMQEHFEGTEQSADEQGDKNDVAEHPFFRAEGFPFRRQPEADQKDGEGDGNELFKSRNGSASCPLQETAAVRDRAIDGGRP